MSKKEVAVKVQDLTKTFKIPLEASNGLKQKLINTLKGRKGYREFSPLKGVSFEIEEGDFFGIVGRNGSGKSTLLKTIAGIYAPDNGLVQVNGKLVPFIELGVGFNPELTGRENVFLNGALLGFSHKQMQNMYDDIVEFAELEDFMEERLKNYSSGMQVRLAFSIAIRAEGDILLLDEVLAVGDEAFQRKCNDYFEQLKEKGRTVVLVTHSMDSVRKYCNKAMMIRDGKVVKYGSPEDVSNEYSLENLHNKKSKQKKKPESERKGLEKEYIESFKVNLISGKNINQNNDIVVRFKVKPAMDIKLKIAMDIQHIDKKAYVFSGGTDLKKYKKGKSYESTVRFRANDLNDMSLRVNSCVKDENDRIVAFIWHEDAPSFMVTRTDHEPNTPRKFAILHDRGEWEL